MLNTRTVFEPFSGGNPTHVKSAPCVRAGFDVDIVVPVGASLVAARRFMECHTLSARVIILRLNGSRDGPLSPAIRSPRLSLDRPAHLNVIKIHIPAVGAVVFVGDGVVSST